MNSDQLLIGYRYLIPGDQDEDDTETEISPPIPSKSIALLQIVFSPPLSSSPIVPPTSASWSVLVDAMAAIENPNPVCFAVDSVKDVAEWNRRWRSPYMFANAPNWYVFCLLFAVINEIVFLSFLFLILSCHMNILGHRNLTIVASNLSSTLGILRCSPESTCDEENPALIHEDLDSWWCLPPLAGNTK